MSEETTGRKIGEFELLETLGEGAAGVAYLARCSQTGERVAVKLLGDEVANEPDMQNRFVREVAVLEKLNHPGIVRHRECGLHDGQIYFAMELVDGGSLDQVLQEGGVLPWREATEVAMQVCAALAYAHSQGIIHRDLKPANLFLSSDGQVKVGDFGLARDNQAHRLTADGQTVGTCRYMAPEQVRGESELSGAVDMYAVGCLMYLMMTGNCPFTGASVVEVFEHHLFTPPVPLDKRGVACPPALVELVERLLSKNVGSRPDAPTTEAALGAILNGEQPVLPDTPDAEEPKNLTERLKETTPPPEKKVNKTAIVATLVIAAIAIIGAVLARM